MAHCRACHSYVEYESYHCNYCSSRAPHLQVARHDLVNTLNEHPLNFRYRMIKGSLAEVIIRELFLTHKYSVHRYGVEYALPAAADSLSNVNTSIAEQIRSMPDFVVQHLLSGETYFVEVKFRADEYFTADHLHKNYPYEDALIVVVSKRHIKCLSVKELRQGQAITPRCNNYLADRPEFELRRDVVVEFCHFAEMFYEKV
jgi:hypothetical protein